MASHANTKVRNRPADSEHLLLHFRSGNFNLSNVTVGDSSWSTCRLPWVFTRSVMDVVSEVVEVDSYWPRQLLLKYIWGVQSYSVRASSTADSERVLCVYKGSKICFGFEFCGGVLIFSMSHFLQLGVSLWLPWFICNDLPKRPAEPRHGSAVLCAFMKCIFSFVDRETERDSQDVWLTPLELDIHF